MEIQQVNQTEFAEMLKSAGNETYQTTFENDAWYEQVTMEEMTYRHKLLSLKKISSELITKKPSACPRKRPRRCPRLQHQVNPVLSPAGQLEKRNGPSQALGDLFRQKPPPKKPQTVCRNAFGYLCSLSYPKCPNRVHNKLCKLVMNLNNTKV